MGTNADRGAKYGLFILRKKSICMFSAILTFCLLGGESRGNEMSGDELSVRRNASAKVQSPKITHIIVIEKNFETAQHWLWF